MRKLMIVTDLDASFIDENYQYTDAMEAVEKLSELGFPLVFNSSKTLDEMQALAKELQLTTPLIAENGGIIAVPHDSELSLLCKPSGHQDWKHHEDYHTLNIGLSREYILKHAHAARDANNYDFCGFTDLSETEVSKLTGLAIPDARKAKLRYVTEPILWNDTAEHWEHFSALMQSMGIRALKGGQFIHLMGPSDKADGLQATRQLYEKGHPQIDWTTVALGDSPNDQSMLESADIAVIIPHKGGARLKVNSPNIIHAKYPASKGWNDAILNLISTL